jgi:hypothetical protein
MNLGWLQSWHEDATLLLRRFDVWRGTWDSPADGTPETDWLGWDGWVNRDRGEG